MTCRFKALAAIVRRTGRETAPWRRGGCACSNANRTVRSTPARVLIDVWIATSSGVPLRENPPAPDVKVFVVLPDDDHVDVVGPLAFDRALDTRIKLDRSQVDVLVEVEPEAEQDSLFENAGGDVGVADGAEQDGVAAAQPLDLGVGQDLSVRR